MVLYSVIIRLHASRQPLDWMDVVRCEGGWSGLRAESCVWVWRWNPCGTLEFNPTQLLGVCSTDGSHPESLKQRLLSLLTELSANSCPVAASFQALHAHATKCSWWVHFIKTDAPRFSFTLLRSFPGLRMRLKDSEEMLKGAKNSFCSKPKHPSSSFSEARQEFQDFLCENISWQNTRALIV